MLKGLRVFDSGSKILQQCEQAVGKLQACRKQVAEYQKLKTDIESAIAALQDVPHGSLLRDYRARMEGHHKLLDNMKTTVTLFRQNNFLAKCVEAEMGDSLNDMSPYAADSDSSN